MSDDEALVDPSRILSWACQGEHGLEHPTTRWLARHLSPRRLYHVRRLGVLHPEDADHYAVLLCQLQVCGRVVDLEVHQDDWGVAALLHQIRAHAPLN